MAAQPGNGLDLNGRLSVVEAHVGHLREADARIDGEIEKLRLFRHAATNIVTGWTEFEKGVDALQQTVRDLQAEVRALRTASDKLTGPGGAIEQLAQLAEDRRFKRRLLGWAAGAGAAAASAWAFIQAVWPYIRIPPVKP